MYHLFWNRIMIKFNEYVKVVVAPVARPVAINSPEFICETLLKLKQLFSLINVKYEYIYFLHFLYNYQKTYF